jgi:hypothetical protein
MPTLERYVFVWRDDDRKLAYVGWGDALESKMLWIERDAYDSPLNNWLRSLDKPPEPAEGSMKFSVTGNVAKASVRQLEKRLENQGFALLSPRDRDTIDAGHKASRPVYVKTGWGRSWFKSVRAAARALKCDASTIVLAAQDKKRDDIQYADEVDQ